MAYQWVALVVTGATGVAGVFFTWLSSRGAARAQLDVLRLGRDHEVDLLRRQEKRDSFQGLLVALDAAQAVLRRQGPLVLGTWADALERIEPARRARVLDDLDADDHPVRFEARLDVRVAMTEAEVAALRAATDEYAEVLERLDQARLRVELTGDPPTVSAVDRVRQDLFDIMDLLTEVGDYRFLDAGLRSAAVAAMRRDLGEDADLQPTGGSAERPEPGSTLPRTANLRTILGDD